MLKTVRREIAEQYGLIYSPTDCSHDGDCPGTCPKCDAELRDLQCQLDAIGKKAIDLNSDILNRIAELADEQAFDNMPMPLEGDIPLHLEGIPAPPFTHKQNKRVLYKECPIAGIAFHNAKDIWDELYEGMELALVRHKGNKYDRYAVAVALADDHDDTPADFDFDSILGYVPRTENEHIALMLDMGWADAFACELSRVNGHNPYKGSLYMKIYIVSRDAEEVADTSHLLRLLELDDEAYGSFLSDLQTKGCSCFRWGGFPPEIHNLPTRADEVVFLHRREKEATLYLMYCIAAGDDDASYFVEDKGSLHAIDDCCYYVFTNITGPIIVENEKIAFLNSEAVDTLQPEVFLSEAASAKLKTLIGGLE